MAAKRRMKRKPEAKAAQATPQPLESPTKEVEVLPAHHNADLTPEKASDVMESYLLGATPPSSMSRGAYTQAVDRFKRIACPAGCPEDQTEWRKEMSRLTAIAAWVCVNRIITENETIPPKQLAVTAAIMADKHLLLAGQPTSFNFSVNASVSHDGLLEKMKAVPSKK